MYTRGSQLIYVAELHDVEIPDYGRPTQFRCPFHKLGHELTPSARFYPATDSFHCFTCNRSWTPLQFQAEIAGTTLKDAVDALKAHGIKVSPRAAKLEEDPKKELDDLIIVTSIRFRARPNTSAKKEMYDICDRVQALVITGEGDAREAVAVARGVIDEYEQGIIAA